MCRQGQGLFTDAGGRSTENIPALLPVLVENFARKILHRSTLVLLLAPKCAPNWKKNFAFFFFAQHMVLKVQNELFMHRRCPLLVGRASLAPAQYSAK